MMLAMRLLPQWSRWSACFLGPWMTVGLARCALLPLSALEKLREKSCEDVHDSAHAP